MRIAEVAPARLHPYSGVLTVIGELSQALAQRGHDVELWQLSPWPAGATSGIEDSLVASGVELVRCDVRHPFRLGPAVGRALAERHPDVFHLHNSFSPANNLLAARVPAPYVITTHGGYAPEQLAFRRRRKALFTRLFDVRLLAGAARVVALTEEERTEIAAVSPRAATVVVPNAAPAVLPGDGAAFRGRLGIGDEPLVVYVGKLDHDHKRVGELVAAVAAAEGWHLALVGPDWRGGRARLDSQVEQLGLTARVKLVGELRDGPLHDAYAAADVFALLSRWEGSSIALLEALAHGKPALVSREVERRLGVAAGGAGWATDPAEAPAVLAKLRTLDRAGWERFRDSARELAARHSWDGVAARYEDVFSDSVAAPS